MIPRRLAFRIISACLRGQARVIGGRTARSSYQRRGPSAGLAAAAKQDGRSDQVDDLVYQAEEISSWVGKPEWYQGPELDPAVVGYLSALAFGHTYAWPDLLQLIDDARLDDCDMRDLPLILERILSR